MRSPLLWSVIPMLKILCRLLKSLFPVSRFSLFSEDIIAILSKTKLLITLAKKKINYFMDLHVRSFEF